MGIRGLTKYMLENLRFEVVCEAYSLNDTTLVLDGLSVCYTLLRIRKEFRSNWVQGGQYWDIKSHFCSFFTRLKESKIKSIVVIDGVPPEDKCEEKKRRGIKKMKRISQGVMEPHSPKYTCHPLHTRDIFCEVLKEFSVEVIFADGEADFDTASLANHYRCPVLANDSDYFMFNLDEGYIPLDPKLFQWEIEGEIKAKRYLLPNFKKEFKNPALAFLIPAIIGNDFIKPSEGVESVEQLIDSLRDCSSLEEFLTSRTQDEVSNIKQKYGKAKEMYNITPVSKEELMSNTKLNKANGEPLRGTRIIEEYHHGNLEVSVLTVLTQGQCMLPLIIDDPQQASSVLIGREIRKSIYRIVAPCLPEDENGVKKVTEIYRNASCDELEIECIVLSRGECQRSYTIDQIPQLEHDKKIEILCTGLEVNPTMLQQFEDEWKLIALSLHYWAKHAKAPDHAKPTVELIYPLALCFIACTVCPYDPTMFIREDEKEIAEVKRRESLHVFAQWKCVYDNIFALNSLLMNPLPFKSFASIFNGGLLMHYTNLTHGAFVEEKTRVFQMDEKKNWKSQYKLLVDLRF